jgi:hypothetical protein
MGMRRRLDPRRCLVLHECDLGAAEVLAGRAARQGAEAGVAQDEPAQAGVRLGADERRRR